MSAKLRARLWLTLPEAARISGTPMSTLRAQCAAGRRRARKVGKGRGHWQVPAKDFRDGGR